MCSDERRVQARRRNFNSPTPYSAAATILYNFLGSQCAVFVAYSSISSHWLKLIIVQSSLDFSEIPWSNGCKRPSQFNIIFLCNFLAYNIYCSSLTLTIKTVAPLHMTRTTWSRSILLTPNSF